MVITTITLNFAVSNILILIIMKTKFYPILLCAALCACGGGNAKQPVADVETTKDTMQVTKGVSKPGGIPYLDFNKKYPSKDICLEEIANVSYIPLETTDKSLIQTILKIDMSDNIIIIGDYSNAVIAFDKQGKFLWSFNKRGGGPEEYNAIITLCVDFDKKEIYILDLYTRYRIMVYSFDGKFIRRLKLDQKVWPSNLYNYDKDYLIAYDIYNETESNANKRPYILINKQNGKVSSIPIKLKKRNSNASWIQKGEQFYIHKHVIEPIIKTEKGVIISDFALDTIYNYQNHHLTPIAIRKNIDESVLSSITAYGSRYSFLNFIERSKNSKGQYEGTTDSKLFLIDKKEGTVYDASIIPSDMKIKNTPIWERYKQDLPNDNLLIKQLSVELLSRLSEENKLKGTLKEVASKLKEDDNPVLMIVHLKR